MEIYRQVLREREGGVQETDEAVQDMDSAVEAVVIAEDPAKNSVAETKKEIPAFEDDDSVVDV